jgi:arsenite methyltransferase
MTTTPQIDEARLEREVKAMYRDVAEQPDGDYHFELGRELAERLGYAKELLDRIPAGAVDSFAGVGYALDMAELEEGERVLDLGSGSGMDVFAAATYVGPSGHVIGIDMTPEQLAKAERLRAEHGFGQIEFRESHIEQLPVDDASVDVVISNGVINLSPHKDAVFGEIARVLRPGGRLAVADIVSSRELKAATVQKVELWAACVAGAITDDAYVKALEDAGMVLARMRDNTDYRFISERAATTCSKYGIKSVSLLAIRAVV